MNNETIIDIERCITEANQGDAKAQNDLGFMLLNGLGVKKNYEEAAKWIKKAAEQEYLIAQNNLGYLYLEGLGVKQNYEEGVKWIKKAAEQECADAQFNLGCLCIEGLGLEQNYEEGVKWIEKAAEQEHAEAQKYLGSFFLHGVGVEQNFVEAEKWYRYSLKNGCVESEYIVNIFNHVKKETINTVESVADEIEDETEAVLISPNLNKNAMTHTLYDKLTFLKIKNKIDNILESIPIVNEDRSNEFEVLEQICKKIAHMVEYGYGRENRIFANNLIGPLLEGKAVCSGYAELLRNLCECRGIKCIFICSSTDHAFNQIKIGENWYYFDLVGSQKAILENKSFDQMLLSEEQFISLNKSNKPGISQTTYDSPLSYLEMKSNKNITVSQVSDSMSNNYLEL